jgi:excisionase family DNA binding protein
MESIINNLTFEQLPAAIAEILLRVKKIEGILNGEVLSRSDEEMLDIEQAAEFLKLSVSTIYGKVCRGELPATKPGRRLYFYRSELSNWRERKRRKTTQDLIQEFKAERNPVTFKARRKASRI